MGKLLYDGGAISFTGMAHNNIITLQDVLTLKPQSISVCDRPGVFSLKDYDGVLGLGPTILITYISEDGTPIPTVIDSLYIQGIIGQAVPGIYFMPYNDRDCGLLSFGNYGDTAMRSMNYMPATNTFPASGYGVLMHLSYIRASLSLTPHLVLLTLETGLLVVLMSHITLIDALLIYLLETGATINPDGWYSITYDQYNNLGILSFIIGGQHYDLSASVQTIPHAHVLPEKGIFLVVGKPHAISASNQDFILGYPFLYLFTHALLIFSNLISISPTGFASAIYTYSTTN
ncbi:hypothetical protein ID866_4021 [Astraeus odoratus]|nr:hypothetical protein ID866_4021 [Astraeus odoratus]